MENRDDRIQALEKQVQELINNQNSSRKNKPVKRFFSWGGFLLVLVSLSFALFSDEISRPFVFRNGNLLSAENLESNFNSLFDEVNKINKVLVPVGGIIAWHKDLDAASTSLPEGFVECDGSLIDDPDSPYYDKNIYAPDLNGKGLFLRGASASGTEQDDRFQSHAHGLSPNPHSHASSQRRAGPLPGGGANLAVAGPDHNPLHDSGHTKIRIENTLLTIGGPITQAGYSSARSGDETRPVNMAVVWIIRIK